MMQRWVEEEMASALGMEDVARESRAQRAKAQAASDTRGVEGISVEQIMEDIMRQEGDAVAIMELNRSAKHRQMTLEALALNAESDQALYNLPVRTYNPTGAIQVPAPVGAVTPAAPKQSPSVGSLVANVGTAVIDGFSTARKNGWDGNIGTIGSSLALQLHIFP